MPFFGDDFESDDALRLCSLAACEVWRRIIWRTWKSPRRGYWLKPNGEPPTVAEGARMLGVSVAELEAALSELGANGVYSRTPEGVIYCRRQVRKAAESEAKQRAARARWNDKASEFEDGPTGEIPIIPVPDELLAASDPSAYAPASTSAYAEPHAEPHAEAHAQPHAPSGYGYGYGCGSGSSSSDPDPDLPSSLLFRREEELRVAKPDRREAEIREVYAHWRRYHPKAPEDLRRFRPKDPRKLTLEWERISEAFDLGFDVEALKRAIDGNHRKEFHVRNKQHHLSLIFRDTEHITGFIHAAEERPEDRLSDTGQSNVRATQRWLERRRAGGTDAER